MVTEFTRDDGSRGIKGDDGKIIANLPSPEETQPPSAASTQNDAKLKTPFKAATRPAKGYPSYEDLYEKVKQEHKPALDPQINSFNEANDKLKGSTEVREAIARELSDAEVDEINAYEALRAAGADLLNTHRPVYNPEAKITRSNKSDWGSARICATCKTTYPCINAAEAVEILDNSSPYAVNAYVGSKVKKMLEEEAFRDLIKSFTEDTVGAAENGVHLGLHIKYSSKSEITYLPVGAAVEVTEGNPFLDDHGLPKEIGTLYLKTDSYHGLSVWVKLEEQSSTWDNPGQHYRDGFFDYHSVVVVGFIPR